MTVSLRTRLSLFYTLIFGVVLTAVGLISYRVLARQLDADATANLAELTSGLHGYLRFDDGEPAIVFDAADADQAAFVEAATHYYQIYEADSGRLLVQSSALEPYGLRFTPAEVSAFRDRPRLTDIATDYGRIRISNSLINANDRVYLLQVGTSLEPMDAALERFLALLLWSVPLGLLAAAIAGRWMAGIALAPLARVADAARGIDVAHLGRRLPVRGAGDELDAVAQSFNDTLGRLEEAVAEMRQFSTALAHELRTPLAALRGEIEMSLLQGREESTEHQRLESQLEELDKLKRLIDQILTLARAEAGEIQLRRERLDLAGLCASIVEQIEPVATAKGVALSIETSAPVVVRGDARWLERLALNLLDNSVKFTDRGGRIVLRVGTNAAEAMLQVIDTGAGISADVLPHVFERFFRADPQGSSNPVGAGIGLSLAKWIVDSHGGRIEAASTPGGETRFTIWLPLA